MFRVQSLHIALCVCAGVLAICSPVFCDEMTFFFGKGLQYRVSVNYFAALLCVDVSKSVSVTNAMPARIFGFVSLPSFRT